MIQPRSLILAVLLSLWANSPSQAELRCPRPLVNLGEIPGGRPFNQQFQVLNGGSEPLTLLAVTSTCNCLAPRLQPRELRPNEEASIDIAVRTLGQPAGPHTWIARLRYRQGQTESELPMTIQAVIKPEVMVQPAILALHGSGPLSSEIILTDFRSQPLRIAQVSSSSASLRVRLDKQGPTASGGWTGSIRVEVPEGVVDGRHDEALTIFTNDAEYRELKVPVTIVKTTRSPVSVSPASVSWTVVKGEPLPPRLLRVRAVGEGPVEIEQVTASDPALSCRWAPGQDGTVTVRIEVDASRLKGRELNGIVQVQVGAPVGTTLTVPVSVRSEVKEQEED